MNKSISYRDSLACTYVFLESPTFFFHFLMVWEKFIYEALQSWKAIL